MTKSASYRHLVDVVEHNGERRSDRPFLHFLADGREITATSTFGGFRADGEELARGLARYAAPGARVVLMLPSGLDYLRVFAGCLVAGAIAVPLLPPTSRKPRHLDRLRTVLVDADPALLVVEDEAVDIARELAASAGAGIAVATVPELRAGAASWQRPSVAGSDIAFLQYTSGSTGTPKGVVVRHENLLANLSGMAAALRVTDDDSIVTWLPLFHDMGLIGAVLGACHAGIPAYLMAPQTFVQAPSVWLETLSRRQATISFAPNVAYEMCARLLPDDAIARLDLRRWRHAVSGAEPIQPATLARFARRMAPAGFRASALRCGYGQAEVTLCAALSDGATEPRLVRVAKAELERHRVALVEGDDAVELVSCGPPLDGHRVAIVDPHTRTPCGAGEVGEIWLAGPSSCDAYWRKDEVSAETLRATLPGDDTAFVRSGDLGFLHDGELVVCGRLKDLIIVAGHNIYPQDVEQAAAHSEAVLRPGRIAAFSVWDAALARETLVIVAEAMRALSATEEAALYTRMRQAVHEAVDCAVDDIVLVAKGSIPMTTSGKIARQAARREHLDGSLQVVARCASSPAVASLPAAMNGDEVRARIAAGDGAEAVYLAYLRGQIAQVRPGAQVAGDGSLVEYGLDSLAIGALHGALLRDLGWAPDMPAMFGDATLAQLAATLARRAPAIAPAPSTTSGASLGPLTHAQQRLWYLHELDPASCQHNLVVRVALRGELDLQALARALDALVERHAILRTAYRSGAIAPEQVVQAAAPGLLRVHDMSSEPAEAQHVVIAARIAAERCTPFDLRAGEVLRVHAVRRGREHHDLIIAAHHVAFDGRSAEIFLEHLDELYRGHAAGPPPVPYLDLAVAERRAFDDAMIADRLAFWREYLHGVPTTLALGSPAATSRPATHRFAISPARCEQVAQHAAMTQGTLFTTLLGLYTVALRHLGAPERFLVGTDVSGRWLPGSQGTIGFFVNQLAIRCGVDAAAPLREHLTRQARDARAAYGRQDLPFDALVSALAPERGDRAPLFQVKLNYQPSRTDARHIGPAEITRVEIAQERGAFDVVLDLVHGAGGIEAALSYDAGALGDAWAQRFQALWQHLLESVGRWIDQPVAALLAEMARWDAALEVERGEQHAATARARLVATRRRPSGA